MTSIDVVNGSRTSDGIFRVNHQVYRAAQELGLDARWIEFVDPSQPGGRFPGGITLQGWRLPNRALEQGVNRLWVFPHRYRDAGRDRILLGDPTFVRFLQANRADRAIVRVNDLRPLTPYSDRVSARWMFRYALPRLRRARQILVYTQTLRSELEQIAGLSGRIFVLPPHIEVTSEFARARMAASVARIHTGDELTVLCVSTDRPYKNVGFFLELARAFENEGPPNIRFVLVSRLGPGLERELARSFRPNLTVVASVPRVEGYYETSDVLVSPSRYEGFGLPVFEAMSYGLPVLATDLRPLREIVARSEALLPPDDLRPWVERLRSLRDERSYERVARENLERAQEFSRERFLRGFAELMA